MTTKETLARCPDCFKLYSIEVASIQQRQPRFECATCSCRFWIPFPECLENASGMIGFKDEGSQAPAVSTPKQNQMTGPTSFFATQATQIKSKPFSCPKCGHSYAGGDVECVKCGILFSRWSEKKAHRSEFSASKELKELWEAVILEYENENRHRQFIRYGWVDSNIEYVTQKYQDLLEANPSDEVALKFQKEIQLLASTRFEVARQPQKSASWHDWTIPRIKLSPALYVLAGVLIASGLLIPGMRNLVGFGSSLLFITLAFRYYFQASRPTSN